MNLNDLRQQVRQSLLNPYPRYRWMREHDPISYDAPRNTWHVFRYDDVARVLTDTTMFSSHFRRHTEGYLFADTMLDVDPPRHNQLRGIVDTVFLPRSTEAMAPRIRAIAHDLLDRVFAAGQMDVISDYAYPLPLIVVGEMLGVPEADRDQLKRWSDLLMGPGEAARRGYDEMTAYFVKFVADQGDNPPDNMFGRLMTAATASEGRLSHGELIDFCSLLLVSGHETVTHLIGNLVLCLTNHPDVWERLHREPGLVPQTVEEVLRYRSPVTFNSREARAGAVLGGHQMQAGAHVVAWIGSANHDEKKFDAPDQFKIDRSPNPHLAFGRGAHYCLGASLGRLEGTIALTALLERMGTIARTSNTPLEPFPSRLIQGVRTLPVTFTARAH